MSSVIPEIYRHDQFVIRRKFLRIGGASFRLESIDGTILATSALEPSRVKEAIRVIEGEKGPEILSITRYHRIDSSLAYQVIDPQTNDDIGSLSCKNWVSSAQNLWEILDHEGIVRGSVTETGSSWKSMIRRLNEMTWLLFPQSFQIVVDGENVGTMKQNYNIAVQSYDIDLTQDSKGLFPRPLSLAAVILLLAIEGRQDD